MTLTYNKREIRAATVDKIHYLRSYPSHIRFEILLSIRWGLHPFNISPAIAETVTFYAISWRSVVIQTYQRVFTSKTAEAPKHRPTRTHCTISQSANKLYRTVKTHGIAVIEML